MTEVQAEKKRVRCRAVALDFGGTISAEYIDHVIGQKPVDPAAATALRALHDRHGLRLILAAIRCHARPAGPPSSQPGSTACSASLCCHMSSESGSRNRCFTGWSSQPPSHRPAR